MSFTSLSAESCAAYSMYYGRGQSFESGTIRSYTKSLSFQVYPFLPKLPTCNGHIERMADVRFPKRTLIGEACGRRSQGEQRKI